MAETRRHHRLPRGAAEAAAVIFFLSLLLLLLASSARASVGVAGQPGDAAADAAGGLLDVQPRGVHRNASSHRGLSRSLKSPAVAGSRASVASSPSAVLDFRSRRRKRRKRIKEGPPPTEAAFFVANFSVSSSLMASSVRRLPAPQQSRIGTRGRVAGVRGQKRRRRKDIVCRKAHGSDVHRCIESGPKRRRVLKGPRDRRWWRRRKGKQRNGERDRSEPRKRKKTKKKPFHVAETSRRRVLSEGGGPRYSSARLYGRWSRWSPCSRSCTTQRFRWCKRPLHCGADVIREEAYCYVEGSFCHRWIHRQIQQQPDTEDNEAGIDPSSDELEFKPVYNGTPMASSDIWSQKGCGISPSSNRTSVVAVRRHQQALRIIGGRESIPGRWPWQVAVLNRFKEAFCGGTLVAPHWILTAAHCVRKRLYVRLGEHDLVEEDGTEAEFRVEEAIIHPDYDADTVDNDVALLRLPMWASSGRGDGTGHGLACLPRPRQALPLRRLCTIIGWGKRKSSDAFGTDILHEAEVPIVSNEICRDVYEEYYITGNMFCAGYRKGRMDSCAGDSGGPLLCLSGRGGDGSNRRWTIFGITSFGEGCGKRGKYGIYTKVSNYVRWVQRVVNGFYGNGRQ
ncbi:uncharacterized protein LOC124160270 [Ischnura elegans]|uniref:uncharacterized protein LOC124160270 n=1 Tax=Ischnura elegans TaxID=197161 RepID=UPI001ED89C14|nr:uncharacterized protein LOC124160270 [Ischnura elegans]